LEKMGREDAHILERGFFFLILLKIKDGKAG
jgi:hypothetical protein